MENFFQIVLNSFERLDLPIEPNELLAVKGNKMLNIVCDYLNRKRRYQLGIKFFNILVDFDFHNVVFLSSIFNSIGNSLDTIKLMAPLLQKNPHVFTLIYQEAFSLLQLKRYDLAGKLTTALIQMIPESFEAWLLLIEVYFSSKNYEAMLLTLNIAPLNPKRTYNNGYCFPNEEKILEGGLLTEPKEKGDSDYFPFNIEVENPDFRYTKLNDEFKYIQQDYIDQNKKKEAELSNLLASKLQDQELQLYKILVRIEREISWEKLLLLRAKLFLMDENVNNNGNLTNSLISNSSLNNKKKESFSTTASLKSQILKPLLSNFHRKIEDYEISDEKGQEEALANSNNDLNNNKSSNANNPDFMSSKTHQKTFEILNKKRPLDSNNEVLNETDEDDSDKEHELPSFLKPEEDLKPLNKPKMNKDLLLSKKDEFSEEMSQSQPVNIQIPASLEDRLMIPVKPLKLCENIENFSNINKKKAEFEENDKELRSHELSIRNITKKQGIEGVAFENPLLDFSKKRLCSKITDSLFEALYGDLNALYEWSQEEYMKQTKNRRKKPESNDDEEEEENKDEEEEEEYIDDLKISGKLWVFRGILAQRLMRNRFAETAYRKAVERGFSLFAWRQLLGIYLEIENFKASLVCIAEILDELENEGVENFVFLPKWIEEAILQIISKAGYKGLTNLLSELNLDDPSINELIKEAAYWKVEGSGNV